MISFIYTNTITVGFRSVYVCTLKTLIQISITLFVVIPQQLGGGDQWGNIHAGCNFVKKNTESTVHGVTLPLLTTSAGEKLGKSINNALWLSPAKTSPYEFYQFFLNTADSDVEKLLRFFTFLSLEEIQNTMAIHQVHHLQ